MIEINKHILKQAIEQLPQHEPKDSLWDDLSHALDADLEQQKLEQTIGELPSYNPPDSIWDNIEEGLDQQGKGRVGSLRTRWMGYVAAAALFGGLIFSVLVLNQSTDSVHISYSEETIELPANTFDWNTDEDAFAYIKELCAIEAPVCKTPDFIDLNTELKELETAKNELQEVLNEFDSQDELIMQMAKIERERSDIMKLMIAMI